MSLIERLAPHILQTLIWIPTRFVLWFFANFEVSGLENIKNLSSEKGVIFASNHASSLDPILLPASLPLFSRFMPMFYTSREQSFYGVSGFFMRIVFSEWFFRSWGAHKVLVGLRDYNQSLEKHVEILKAGKSLMIFPEGKTTTDGSLRPPKPGVAFLLDKTNSPVVPVYISGTFGVPLSHLFRFFSKAPESKRLSLHFGKPLTKKDVFSNSKNIRLEDYKKGATQIMNEISLLRERVVKK